jgi:hypothetical protein
MADGIPYGKEPKKEIGMVFYIKSNPDVRHIREYALSHHMEIYK